MSQYFDVAKMTKNNDPVPELPSKVELEQLLKRLSQERCDGYGEWLWVGMALYDDDLDEDALDDRFEL